MGARVLESVGIGLVHKESIGDTWEFPKIGVPYFGALMIRILLFRILF